MRKISLVSGLVLGAAVALAALAGCSRNTGAETDIDLLLVPVERRDIVVQVSATGIIEPIRIIEIKSKASGEIIRMPVETGDVIAKGALLAQVDTTDVAAALRQSEADLDVVRARLIIAGRQRARADTLLRRGMISADEYDRAILEHTTARANLIKTETSVQQARERVDDTVVRAPSTGTIISKTVEQGQIIASATREVTGGTTLLKMADLTRVQVRALVDETDLGKVRSGQRVTVQVDAFPERTFHGSILKVEPQAVDQQSITFFPVLIHIDNEDGVLRPGMNANVDIHILRRDGVLALPSEAIKTVRNAALTAPLLGLNPDSVREALATPPKPSDMPPASPDVESPLGGERGRLAMRPEGDGPPGQPGRPGMARDPETRRLLRSLDPEARRKLRSAEPEERRRMIEEIRQGQGAELDRAETAETAVVFVRETHGVRPVLVYTGAQTWEYTEIVSGLAEGAQVVVPPSASLAQQSQEFRERVQRWSGGRVMGR